MVTAIETVKSALSGGDLDSRVLEKLSFEPYEADAVRDELLPLLVQLLAQRPEKAVEVPESLVNVLLRKMSLHEVLQATGLSEDSLSDAVVRPLLLNQLVLKARASENDPLTQQLLERAFKLTLDSELESKSVALIEKLTVSVPKTARKFIPFAELFQGSAIQNSRVMEFNTTLLKLGVVPPTEFLCYKDFSYESDDQLLEVLKIDHLGNILEYFVKYSEIQKSVHESLYAMTAIYKPDTLLSISMESTLYKCCSFVESLFLELDAQFLLISTERLALLARIPAHYIVKHHIEVIDELEVSSRTLPAVVNICKNVTGLQRLNIPQSKLLNMTVLSQMEVAAASTSSKEGVEYFETKYRDVLKNALAAPETDQTRDYKAVIELNLRVFGNWSHFPRASPQVHSGSG